MEFSVGSLVAGEAVPFKHKHKQNEEVYVILSGQGIFSLDGEEFPVVSGSVVRVAPSVVRTHRNTGDQRAARCPQKVFAPSPRPATHA